MNAGNALNLDMKSISAADIQIHKKNVHLTFHAFIDRLIVGVCAALWSLGGLDKQNCVRLYKGIQTNGNTARS